MVPSDILWSVLIALSAIVALGIDNVKFLLSIESDHKMLSRRFFRSTAHRKSIFLPYSKCKSLRAQNARTVTSSPAVGRRLSNSQ
ncbi:hypothetical protein D3C76_679840 [compost metagenome]